MRLRRGKQSLNRARQYGFECDADVVGQHTRSPTLRGKPFVCVAWS